MSKVVEQPLHVDDIWMSLAKCYSDVFFSMETGEYFKMIGGTTVTIECWMQIYSVMVKRKLMDRIEDLPEDFKATLWNDAKGYLPDESKEKTIKVCKAIHAISTYIQL